MPESARFDELGIPVLQGGEDVKRASGTSLTARQGTRTLSTRKRGQSGSVRNMTA
jgi:hypothetical protein